MADQDPVAGGPGDGQAQDTGYAAFLKAHDAQSSGPAAAPTGAPKTSAAPDTGAPADSGYQAFLSAHDQQTGPPAADHASDAPSDGVGIAGAPSSPFQAVAQDMGHGVLSAPAGLLGTPRALGHGAVGAFAGDNPTLHKAVDSATDFLEGPRQAAQSFADRIAPMATDEQLGLGGHPTIAKGVGMAADAVGGLAAGAAGGALLGRTGQILKGGGVKPVIAGQLEDAAQATSPAYAKLAGKTITHPDVVSLVNSDIPEFQQASKEADNLMALKQARSGEPAAPDGVTAASARQRVAEKMGVAADDPLVDQFMGRFGGPTTPPAPTDVSVTKFDLFRRNVNDIIGRLRSSPDPNNRILQTKAEYLDQLLRDATAKADQQVPEYAAARGAATREKDLGRVTDYLGNRDTPGVGDLARLLGNGVRAAHGSPVGAVRLANVASRFAQAGADATATLGPREVNILTNARKLAAAQARTTGAVIGAGTTVGRLQSRGSP